jgi:hypothetical protein
MGVLEPPPDRSSSNPSRELAPRAEASRRRHRKNNSVRQRRPSCGYSPTTDSRPASPWRRSSRTSEEVANVWRLWKAGIVRENYARADEPGVVIVFELDSVAEAKRYTHDFPLTKAGFLEWFFIPLMVPLPIESLFRSEVDAAEPHDRTTTVSR